MGSKPKNSSLEYEEDCWSFTPLIFIKLFSWSQPPTKCSLSIAANEGKDMEL